MTTSERNAVEMAFNDFTELEKAFVGIILYTGLRRGEVLALTKDDIDFESRLIHVSKTTCRKDSGESIVQNNPKSKAGNRSVPMPKPLCELLRTYVDKINDERLFITHSGTYISSSNFDYRWKRIKAKINRYLPIDEQTDITPHYFRHNYATDLIYSGVPLKTVQYLLGHEKFDMTMNIYADVRLDVDNVVNTLEVYYNNIDSQKTVRHEK